MSKQAMCFDASLMDDSFWGVEFERVQCITDTEVIQQALDDIFFSKPLDEEDVDTDPELFYMDRAICENDPSYKQVIPYVIIKQGNMVLRYQRTESAGETRLHNLYSIGIGGHVEPIDGEVASFNAYKKALERELLEEIGYETTLVDQMHVAGLLYDDSDEVGQVHFGIVHIIPIPQTLTLRLEDPSITNAEFVHQLDIRNLPGDSKFENWSEIAIRHLF